MFDVRFGSKADPCAKAHVCFAPESRHVQCIGSRRLRAKSGHTVTRTPFFHQRAQRGFGRTVLIEIRRRKPSFHDFAHLWPFVVKDRVPSRISISALEDHVVVENALKAEAQSASRRTGSSI